MDSIPERSARKRLLFISVENSSRSQMAEAFARIHGRDKVAAYSAGSRPAGEINPRALEALRRLGYDLSQHRSKSLQEIPDIEFDFVATIGCWNEFPHVRGKLLEDWNIPDPTDLSDAEFTAVRDQIESEVVSMLLELRIAGHLR